MRAWIEASAQEASDPYADGGDASVPAPLRVRVVEVGAAPGEERTLCVTADPAEAADAVRGWLERLTR